MLYKKNLVLIENLIGLVCFVCMIVIFVMENVVLWYECDILYLFVECGIGLDVIVIFDFVLNWLMGVIDKMLVFLENMLDNMNKFFGFVML